ncbi:MAG: hypothetical protein DBX47_02845 [Clostridiales bacterium]|nr:MAG: hypothetical protein DBX47_02845 [Clostridiales bacterium]
MKKTLGFLMLIVVVGSFTSCGSTNNKTKEIIIFEMQPTKDGVADFLFKLDDQPESYDNDECYRVTPQRITNKYGFAIYKFDQSCISYLEYDDKIYPLGNGFGGFGVVSFAISDMNNDKYPELYFTYSWGSGIHRSMVGYFDSAIKEVVLFDYSNMNNDMVFVADKNRLFTYNATTDIKSFVNIGVKAEDKVGEISFSSNKIELDLVDANK